MKKIIISTILALLIIFGYFYGERMLIYAFGYRDIKLENQASILEFYKRETNTQNLFVLSDAEAFKKYIKLSVPAFFIFDKDGHLVVSGKGKGCVNSAKAELDNLNCSVQLSRDSSYPPNFYDELMSALQPIHVQDQNKNYCFVVVYFWAKYMPKHSRRFIEIEHKQNDNVKIYSVNVDFNSDILGRDYEIGAVEFVK